MLNIRIWFAVILIVFVLAPAGKAFAEDCTETLILVDTKDTAAIEGLKQTRGTVYHQSDWHVVAGVDNRRLSELGASIKILDNDPWSGGAQYYWIIVRSSDGVALIETNGIQVLYKRKGNALIKARAPDAEALAQHGFEITLISRTAKPLSIGRKSSSREGLREFGGVIDEMVAAILEENYTVTIQALEDFNTRYTHSSNIDDAADWIYNTFQGFGLEVERDEFEIVERDTKENIIATIPGLVYPDQVVFITSHYDSISEDPHNFAPGADDNASGTAAVIEAARVLSGYNFARTIKFACFAGEEQGLVGSADYVSDIYADGMNVVGCFNFDMIGYDGDDPLPPDLVIYYDPASTALANALRDAALYYVSSEIEPVIVEQDFEGASDHSSFWQYGYPAVMGIEAELGDPWPGPDFNPHYHSTDDLVSNCDLDYATACTKAGVAAVAELATCVLCEGHDTCLDAFDVGHGGTFFGNSNACMNNYWDYSSFSWSLHGPDQVYALNLECGDCEICITLTPQSNWDPGLAIAFECAEGVIEPVAAADSTLGGDPETLCYTSSTGEIGTLYIFVDSYGSGASGGDYELDVSVVCKENDTCSTAVDISGGGTYSGDTCCAFDDYNGAYCIPWSTPGPDLTYQITIGDASHVDISVTPDSSWDPAIYLVSDCEEIAMTCVGGADVGFEGDPESLSLDVDCGGTYFLIIDSYYPSGSTSCGSFQLDVNTSTAGAQDTFNVDLTCPLDPIALPGMAGMTLLITNTSDFTRIFCGGTDVTLCTGHTLYNTVAGCVELPAGGRKFYQWRKLIPAITTRTCNCGLVFTDHTFDATPCENTNMIPAGWAESDSCVVTTTCED